jgi:hypothetical protein
MHLHGSRQMKVTGDYVRPVVANIASVEFSEYG